MGVEELEITETAKRTGVQARAGILGTARRAEIQGTAETAETVGTAETAETEGTTERAERVEIAEVVGMVTAVTFAEVRGDEMA